MSEDHILSQTARCSNVPGNDGAPLLLESVHAVLERSKLSIRAPPMQKLANPAAAFSGLKEQLLSQAHTHSTESQNRPAAAAPLCLGPTRSMCSKKKKTSICVILLLVHLNTHLAASISALGMSITVDHRKMSDVTFFENDLRTNSHTIYRRRTHVMLLFER